MLRFQTPVFRESAPNDIHGLVAGFKRQGFRFVQLCATTKDASCELLYVFTDPDAPASELLGVHVDVPDGTSIPSITDLYPAAFVFENETHDLFGVEISGINIDFDGEFYTVSTDYPMNPRAAQAQAVRAAANEAAGAAVAAQRDAAVAQEAAGSAVREADAAAEVAGVPGASAQSMHDAADARELAEDLAAFSGDAQAAADRTRTAADKLGADADATEAADE